jgi:hypothetical protein
MMEGWGVWISISDDKGFGALQPLGLLFKDGRGKIWESLSGSVAVGGLGGSGCDSGDLCLQIFDNGVGFHRIVLGRSVDALDLCLKMQDALVLCCNVGFEGGDAL